MHSAELRNRFLKFFVAHGHTERPSDGLIPSGDPTVLFTSAGMNQFKDYFLGKRTDLKRAASCQKCLRTGDLERVGKTASHHSFFEMLGNFSFGDYFKREAIQWAWEFLTGTLDYAGTPSPHQKTLCLSLPKEKLWVSIYEEDEEAFALWRKLGVPENRIKRFGQADNFWPANAPKEGPNGPCGPCSEIYYDSDGTVDGKKSVEVWNLVFTQFERQPDGSLKPLPKPNIDTGMGLERLTRVIQGVPTDYETDLFAPIMSAIHALPQTTTRASAAAQRRATYAVADHVRAATFLIAEGLLPSNESRGYVLRMLIRRAHRFGRSVYGLLGGPNGTFLADLVESVELAMTGSPYAGMLAERREVVRRALVQEESQFIDTLQAGTARLEELLRKHAAARTIPGEEAFKLYDTYGFPVELTVDIAGEQGLTVDHAGFDAALKAQQERSRAKSQFGKHIFHTQTIGISAKPDLEIIPPPKEISKTVNITSSSDFIVSPAGGLPRPAGKNEFTGYELDRDEGTERTIEGIFDLKQNKWIPQANSQQEVALVLKPSSPFYGESGGQVSDRGFIQGLRGRAEVLDVQWVDDLLLHRVVVREGIVQINEPVKVSVDAERRLRVARSHTATHLLHWALRKVLGPDAVQAGSSVEVERVRFDFSSLQPLHEEQRHEVEALVNRRVRLVDEVHTDQMRVEEAKQAGALALFGEKYGSKVRVVTIGDYSKELCGGTHVAHTGFVGSFLITAESSIAAGTRRVEALVGEAAAETQRRQQHLLHDAAKRLGRPADEVVQGLEELLEQLKRSERERKVLQTELAKVEASRLVAEGKKINGVTFVTSTIKHADRELLVTFADAIRGTIKQNGEEGVVLLAGSSGPEQVAFVMATTSGAARQVHAGNLLKAIAPLTQGSGGGRPEFAQAGGRDPSGIPTAMKRAEELVREALK